tara:strand:- start:9 stop:671 length:663 start_codon:yes stop_codon:yes gene_type:complete
MRTLILTSLCLLSSYFLSSQFDDSKHRLGFVSGFGGQNIDQLLSDMNHNDAKKIRDHTLSKGENTDSPGLSVTYDYQVLFFQLQYYWGFLNREKWGLDLLVQHQYNLTKFRHIDNIANEINGYEFGVNAGVLIRRVLLGEVLYLYGLISSGPHYVSGTPERQADGFIFSDNFLLGFNVKLLENLFFDFRSGFRHISNAGLNHTNGGVNDLVLSGGVFINL